MPQPGNANGARVKMMRLRRVYVGADLERLFADYLTHVACRAASLGLAVTPDSPLLVNLDRPPLLAAVREGTVRDKVTALKKKGIGPAGWTPHWFRHSHASALQRRGVASNATFRNLREDGAVRAASPARLGGDHDGRAKPAGREAVIGQCCVIHHDDASTLVALVHTMMRQKQRKIAATRADATIGWSTR